MSQPFENPPADLQEQVRAALRHWHAPADGPSPFASLLLFAQARRAQGLDDHAATNRILYQALMVMEERYPQEARLLHRSDLDNALDDFVANELNISIATLYRHKRMADRHLAEILWGLEQQARATYMARQLARLPAPTYTRLWGVEPHLQRLAQVLTTAEPPWIVALAGMGGLGKTSLADALVRRLLAQGAVAEVGWVTARQSVFEWGSAPRPLAKPALSLAALAEELLDQLAEGPAPVRQDGRAALTLLRGRLKQEPHLIVVDNLETVTDLTELVEGLSELAGPTKFLLTSRESLFHQPAIYHYAVPELAPADARGLIRQEAQERNLPALQQASDAELQPILDVVGGNPLAIRLVVGQTYIYPLAVVLENLAQARGERSENLYTYLYRHAWERLDETSRRALLAMPLVAAAGADLAHLAAVSGLDLNALAQALATLVRLNLVDVQGDLQQRRYTIHNLTRTFLHEQVIRWQ